MRKRAFLITGRTAVFIALAGVVVGILAGFVACNLRSQRSMEVNWLLYGDEKEVDEIIAGIREEDNDFYMAIRTMAADYGGGPPVPTERKLLLLDRLSMMESAWKLSSSLASATITDESPEVRSAYVWVLSHWQKCLLGAKRVIALNLDDETDDEVRREKEAFLQLTESGPD